MQNTKSDAIILTCNKFNENIKMTQAINNVVYLQTQISVPATDAITDEPMLAVYEAVVAMKQKIEAQKQLLDEGIEVLKKYMGDSDTLISKDGRKLATWNWIKGAVSIDRKALEVHFADVFEVVKKVGKETRRFELK